MRTFELHDQLDDLAGPARFATDAGLRDVHRRVRRSRRRIVTATLVGLACFALVGALVSRASTGAPRIQSDPDSASLPIAPATPLPAGSDALGLRVQLPDGWALASGRCPTPYAVVVVDQVTPQPIPTDCPSVDGPWMAIQRIPRSLDGIDTSCGPGLIDNMPMCQAYQEDTSGNPNSFGIERRLYAGLDVLVSIGHDKRVGDKRVSAGPPGLSYSDPAVAQAVASGAYPIPQVVTIAERTIEEAAATGCDTLSSQLTSAAVADCSTLTFPTNIVVKEAGAASLGGAVPATYTIVSLTGDNGIARYRVLVRNAWNTQTRWVEPVVAHIERYDGPYPPDSSQSCTTPPTDPRFKSPGPDPCSIAGSNGEAPLPTISTSGP